VTAPHQVEGNNLNSDFWAAEGAMPGMERSGDACDSYHRYAEDMRLLADAGLNSYRFGIEWARLIPKPGKVNEETVQRYRQEILALQTRGIQPLMTIHHFTNPMWFENLGGFTKRENLHYYLELVELAAERFGDLVSDYITINEPNVYATNSYFFGMWPPAKTSLTDTIRVMENMAYCHIKAYGILHTKRKAMGYTDTKVGVANHLRVFAPKNGKNPWHRLCAKLNEYLFQGALLKAMSLGDFPLPLRNFARLPSARRYIPATINAGAEAKRGAKKAPLFIAYSAA
jgi:beta-glucosidase